MFVSDFGDISSIVLVVVPFVPLFIIILRFVIGLPFSPSWRGNRTPSFVPDAICRTTVSGFRCYSQSDSSSKDGSIYCRRDNTSAPRLSPVLSSFGSFTFRRRVHFRSASRTLSTYSSIAPAPHCLP